jgi:hypothetical protein
LGEQSDLAEDAVEAWQRLCLDRGAARVEERQAIGGQDDGVGSVPQITPLAAI